MVVVQKTIRLNARRRGFHFITNEIEDVIREFPHAEFGSPHIFIKHTSGSLSINENADPKY